MVTESRAAFGQKGQVVGVEPGELLMKSGERERVLC